MTDRSVKGIQRDAIAAGAALPPDVARARAEAAVPALTLGKLGETVETPGVVRFAGACVVVWTEPQTDPSAIRIQFDLSANLMLVQRFQLDLLLSDKAAWAVIADASISGPVYPNENHTVTLQRYHWNGSVKIVAVVSGHDYVGESHAGVPQEVWKRFRAAHEFYCTNDGDR